MKVAVIGAGSFGTTLAQVFAQKAAQVMVWTRDDDVAKHINTYHAHPLRFTDVKLATNINASTDLKQVLAKASIVVSALPMKALRTGAAACNRYIEHDALFVSTTKGIEPDTLLFPHQILNEALTKHDELRRASLSGPNFASEIIRGLLWAAVIGAKSSATSKSLQTLLHSATMRAYTTTDVLGVEVCGALKNVFAIAAGIVDGCELGHNARAAMITRALAEMSSFGVALGAKQKTMYGLSGLGDLLLSCTSTQSRNFRVGQALASGRTPKEIQDELGEVAEGIGTTAAASVLAARFKLEAPITHAVNGVLLGSVSLKDAISQLMSRHASEE
jgi:glycerol-3-phosphate dehydrogenase (NAD(P)+)